MSVYGPNAKPTPPISMMVRFSAPLSYGRVQEYGIKVIQLATNVGSLEASKLSYLNRSPVGAVSETYRLSDSYYGRPVIDSIEALRTAVRELKLDSNKGSNDALPRMTPNQMRISITETPTSGSSTWTFNLDEAPQGTRDAFDAAVNLINLTALNTRPEKRYWAHVPNWEEVSGYIPSKTYRPIPGEPGQARP